MDKAYYYKRTLPNKGEFLTKEEDAAIVEASKFANHLVVGYFNEKRTILVVEAVIDGDENIKKLNEIFAKVNFHSDLKETLKNENN